MDSAVSSPRNRLKSYKSQDSLTDRDLFNLPNIDAKPMSRLSSALITKDIQTHEMSQVASEILARDAKKVKRLKHTKDISYRLDTVKKARKSSMPASELLTQLGYQSPECSSLPRDLTGLVSPVHLPGNLATNFASSPRTCGPPPGRRDADILTKWLREMMVTLKNREPNLSLDQIFENARLIYTICFDEVVRQVSIH